MMIGRGSAWALRWFAKPDVTGSIPASASMRASERYESLGGVLEMIFDGVGGSGQAMADLKAAAYNKGYAPPKARIWLARQLVTHLRQDRDHWREQAIQARKDLSALKRGK